MSQLAHSSTAELVCSLLPSIDFGVSPSLWQTSGLRIAGHCDSFKNRLSLTAGTKSNIAKAITDGKMVAANAQSDPVKHQATNIEHWLHTDALYGVEYAKVSTSFECFAVGGDTCDAVALLLTFCHSVCCTVLKHVATVVSSTRSFLHTQVFFTCKNAGVSSACQMLCLQP